MFPVPGHLAWLIAALPGLVLIGALLASFEAAPAVLALCALLLLYLTRSGTDALVLSNVLITVLFFIVVRARIWPEAWLTIGPEARPQFWASLLFGMWLACVLTSIALGQAAQSMRIADDRLALRLRFILVPAGLAAALGFWIGH